MNQRLTINKEYWLERNPEIEFRRVKKAYYGTHLLKAKVYICGASMRYYEHDVPRAKRNNNPTYDQFMLFLKKHVMRFNMQKLVKTEDNRFVHVERSHQGSHRHAYRGPQLRIYDAHTLYTLYQMLKNKPDGIRFTREYDNFYIYSTDIDKLQEVIDQLGVPAADIKSITGPNKDEIELLLAGKEFSEKASRFKFKVFLKSARTGGIPNLANYLASIEGSDEVEIPKHCRIAISGPSDKWSWAYSQRSYLYVKNEDTILIIQLLAGDRYSNCIELILPSEEIDK